MGLTNKGYASALVKLSVALTQAGIAFAYGNADCSDIVPGRATAVEIVRANPHVTHLLFVDSDMDHEPADAVLRMLDAGVDVVGGAYLSRGKEPFWVGKSLSHERSAKGLIEASYLGTGFMLIKRGVFDRLVEAYPNLAIKFGIRGDQPGWLFFDARRSDDDPSIYIGDDYGFCEIWRRIGGKLWIYPDVTFWHYFMSVNESNYGKCLEAKSPPLAAIQE